MSLITGKIESIASNGAGILRHDGQVIFAPFTAVGDEVLVEITKTRKNYAEAVLKEIKIAGLARISPVCPYFKKCGGCKLQHISYEEQLRVKMEFLSSSLRKIGKLLDVKPLPIAPAKNIYSYRRHIRLHRKNGAIGFVSNDREGIIDIEYCPIFDERDREKIASLKTRNISNCEEIVLHKYSDQNTLEFSIDELTFSYGEKSFVQANPEMAENIYREVRSQVKETRPRKILDLYCGVGATTLLSAAFADEILGVEFNSSAVKLARKNQRRNKIANASFMRADVDKKLASILENFKPDFMIINPPRTGMSKASRDALTADPSGNLLYISCSHATLARDLKDIMACGYKIATIKPYDMFPQTVHMEVVTRLIRD